MAYISSSIILSRTENTIPIVKICNVFANDKKESKSIYDSILIKKFLK